MKKPEQVFNEFNIEKKTNFKANKFLLPYYIVFNDSQFIKM